MPASLLALALAPLLLACRSYDLPPVMASSDHFRYHARSPDDVPPGILDGLEAHRADVLGYFGVLAQQDGAGSVVDYYRFQDQADRDHNSPCGADRDCEAEGKVYSAVPASEFELVHAYLARVGNPPRLIQEGMGAVVSWSGQNPGTSLSPADWTQAATDDGQKGYIQSGGYMLTLYLLRSYGPRRLIDYFASVDLTEDPALLDLEFQRFWGRTVGEVWKVMGGTPGPANPPSFDPICPCLAGTLPNDGTRVDLPTSYMGLPPYVRLAAPEDRALRLTLGPGSTEGSVRDCLRNGRTLPLAEPSPQGTSLAILRLTPGAYFLSFGSQGDHAVTSEAGPWATLACGDAQAVPLAANVEKLTVVVPGARASQDAGAVWYLHLSSQTPRQIAIAIPPDPTPPGVRTCADCTGARCAPLDPVQAFTGDIFLEITPGNGDSLANQWLDFLLPRLE